MFRVFVGYFASGPLFQGGDWSLWMKFHRIYLKARYGFFRGVVAVVGVERCVVGVGLPTTYLLHP